MSQSILHNTKLELFVLTFSSTYLTVSKSGQFCPKWLKGEVLYINLIFNRFLDLCGAAPQRSKKKLKKLTFNVETDVHKFIEIKL